VQKTNKQTNKQTKQSKLKTNKQKRSVICDVRFPVV